MRTTTQSRFPAAIGLSSVTRLNSHFPALMGRLWCGLMLALAVGGSAVRGADETPPPPPPPHRGLQIATEVGATCLTTPAKRGLRVLILSDSMGLGGFSAELDACFRACPGVAAVHTIVAGGTNPLSWLNKPPYATVSTRSGYWSIESVAGKTKPEEVKDVSGMTKGHKPASHRVPKIEDLVERIQPEIVVFQNGNNFFDFFKEGEVIKEESHGKQIRAHVLPLLRWLATTGSSVKKFYWVSPAQTGCATPAVQQFVFDCISHDVAKIGVMLDSRKITSYPYRLQQPDKMHFWGQEALDWGADTFRLIAQDLVANDLATAQALPQRQIDFDAPAATVVIAGDVSLRVRLKALTKVPEPAAFAPYGEFLVGYLYEVLEVLAGTCEDKELLVMHPAYINHVKLDLTRYREGKEYTLVVSEIAETSLWATVHRRDSVGAPELFPYMLNEDIGRHPDITKSAEHKP